MSFSAHSHFPEYIARRSQKKTSIPIVSPRCLDHPPLPPPPATGFLLPETKPGRAGDEERYGASPWYPGPRVQEPELAPRQVPLLQVVRSRRFFLGNLSAVAATVASAI